MVLTLSFPAQVLSHLSPDVATLQILYRQGQESDLHDLVDQPLVCLSLGLLHQGELPDLQGEGVS